MKCEECHEENRPSLLNKGRSWMAETKARFLVLS